MTIDASMLAHGLMLDTLLSYTAIVRERGISGSEARTALHDVLSDVLNTIATEPWREGALRDVLDAFGGVAADAWIEAEVQKRQRDVRLSLALMDALDAEADGENPDTEIDAASVEIVRNVAGG